MTFSVHSLDSAHFRLTRAMVVSAAGPFDYFFGRFLLALCRGRLRFVGKVVTCAILQG